MTTASDLQRSRNARLGLCIHSCGIRLAADKGTAGSISDPLAFLEYCHRLGAAGLQMPLGIRDAEYAALFRERAQAYGLFVEGSAGPLAAAGAMERFEAEVRTARAMGARIVRTVLLPGRRYEQYSSREEFDALSERAWKALTLAEPILARHAMRLAVENHKDQRVTEKLDFIRRLDSEWVGLCIDTGNDLSLLEEPMALVEAYAPYAFTVHLKDMAVEPSADGFLLSEVPLGEGILDLPRMVGAVRRASPNAQITVEMITRDPLPVPCLAERYWPALGDVPGAELARTLRLVRGNASSLPRVTHLPPEEQLRVEEENIVRSLEYAAEHLEL